MNNELHHYGDYIVAGELAERTSIHASGTIDVQVDPDGRVVAVWFRCLNLPFTVSTVDYEGCEREIQPRTRVTAVEYVDTR